MCAGVYTHYYTDSPYAKILLETVIFCEYATESSLRVGDIAMIGDVKQKKEGENTSSEVLPVGSRHIYGFPLRLKVEFIDNKDSLRVHCTLYILSCS